MIFILLAYVGIAQETEYSFIPGIGLGTCKGPVMSLRRLHYSKDFKEFGFGYGVDFIHLTGVRKIEYVELGFDREFQGNIKRTLFNPKAYIYMGSRGDNGYFYYGLNLGFCYGYYNEFDTRVDDGTSTEPMMSVIFEKWAYTGGASFGMQLGYSIFTSKRSGITLEASYNAALLSDLITDYITLSVGYTYTIGRDYQQKAKTPPQRTTYKRDTSKNQYHYYNGRMIPSYMNK